MREMPKFTKSPPELVDRFNAVVDRVAPDAERKKMFGYPCAWVGGNMATGLFADSWWVRLAPERLEEEASSGRGHPFEVMPGRSMKGYVAMREDVIADDALVDALVAEAIAYTGTLPPKKKR